MGLRFHKSLGLGRHSHVNISKSGIGISASNHGFSYSISGNGRRRATMALIGTGLAYTAYNHKRKSAARRSASEAGDEVSSEDAAALIPTISAYSLDIKACQPDDPERLAIVKQVPRIQRAIYTCTCVLLISFIATPLFPPALIMAFIALFGIYYFNYMPHIKLRDAAVVDPIGYDLIKTLWQKLSCCSALWCIKSRMDLPPDKCESEHVASRDRVSTTQKLPYYMRMTGKPMGLSVGGATLYFMPDVIFIVMDGSSRANCYAGFIPYSDLEINAELITQIEHKQIRDAMEVKRLGDAPIYQYGKVTFSTRSDNRLHVEIITSNLAPVLYLKETTDKLEAEQRAKKAE